MATREPTPSEHIDARIKELGDWRGDTLATVRALIHEVDPDVEEGWKWRGVPTWEHDGIICTGETYKAVVKLTFAKGASLQRVAHGWCTGPNRCPVLACTSRVRAPSCRKNPGRTEGS